MASKMLDSKIKRRTPEQVKRLLNTLRGERGTWDVHFQEITDHILPRKNTITSEKYPGTKRTFQLLDNVGIHSNELLAGALHSMLTNPDSFWFEFTTGDIAMDNHDDVRPWLQAAQRTTHNVINNSNFQTEVHELYIDLGALGTAAQLIEEDQEDVVRFSTKFIKEYYIRENSRGVVAEIIREWDSTPTKLVEEFGVAVLPERIQKMYEKGDDAKVKCIHAVYSKVSAGEEKPGPMPYVSQYILPEYDHEVHVGQFSTFPYVVPRFSKASGEVYGRSPGMTALPEMKILNKMNETMLRGAQKMVDPPIQMPDDGFVLPIVTTPSGINYYRAGSQDRIQPLFATTNVEFGYQAMADRRQRVRDAFYVDQLKLQQGGPAMTATEVLQRTEDAMRLLGPLLGRMQSEFLRPMIDRVFNILAKRGLILPAPEILRGQKLDVRYSSLIAKSQRVNEMQNISRFIQTVAPFLQITPNVADNLNGDAAVRIVASGYGLPQEMIVPAREVQKTRDARAEQQQQMAEQQQQMAQMQMTNAAMSAAGTESGT